MISSQALNLIRQFEGFKATPYQCPGGYATIGYGHVIQKGEHYVSITKGQADELLRHDAIRTIEALNRLIRIPLTPNQWDSLLSFVFNIGPGAFQASILRRCINRGEHRAVPKEMMKWVKARGRILPGLVKRRRVEAALYAEPSTG